jgi:phosphatidylinositol-3,4,5-trisphosphate 3-phosphatase/dual-specificity protein phosphatase PTEN
LIVYGAETYMIFNLCSERMYDPAIFNNRVEFWPFDDHQPPYFEMLRPLCARIENYLLEKPANIAAVHCKAGKGRTVRKD